MMYSPVVLTRFRSNTISAISPMYLYRKSMSNPRLSFGLGPAASSRFALALSSRWRASITALPPAFPRDVVGEADAQEGPPPRHQHHLEQADEAQQPVRDVRAGESSERATERDQREQPFSGFIVVDVVGV